jgi:DHA2 family multidrug resistance protein-like MFS transporter
MSTEPISANGPFTADGSPAERRRWAAAAIFTALAMASLDTAIANIALPAIAADLHAGPSDVIWVVNVYQIVLVATLLPLAALGESLGHHRIYLTGLLVFTLASLACASAWSLPSLLIARVLQGFGASGVLSVNTALVRLVYPGRLEGRGFGLNALVVATAFTLGPTVASGLLAIGPWTLLFAINIPFGVVAFLIGLRTLPRTLGVARSFDFPGALLAALCLGLFIMGIGGMAHHEGAGLVSIEIVFAALVGWVLSRRQADAPAPVLPFDLFRRPLFALSAATAVCSFSVQGLAFVSLPFYFENILGRSQVQTGFFMTPWPLVVAIMAPIAGRLSDRYPAGILGGLGLALLGLGMTLLASLPTSPHIADVVWRMAICGCGFGFFQAPNMKALMSSAPDDRSGSASGMVATARLTGQTIGAALAAFCFGLVGAKGAALALVLGAGISAAGCGMSVLRLAASSQRAA